MGRRRTIVLAVGVFVLVLISLQIFLLMVGLEALLTYDRPLAWTTAVTSVALAAVSAVLYVYVRGPGGQERVSRHNPRH